MPAIAVDDTLVLPRIPRPDPATATPRPVAKVITAHRQSEGAGFVVRRPFPGDLSLADADPFLLLDQAGPSVNGPGDAKGAPWHPHRGFETVSYILDGEIAHHDTNGGGGVIAEGDTQWMTAYVLSGRGTVGPENRPVEDGQLVVFGPGDQVVVTAADRQADPLEVIVLGGLPIREPIAHYGPFVMNTREEIMQAVDDYQAGKLGIIPADQLAPRNFA